MRWAIFWEIFSQTHLVTLAICAYLSLSFKGYLREKNPKILSRLEKIAVARRCATGFHFSCK
jgi:hypothetical protein